MKFPIMDRFDSLVFRNKQFIHEDSYVSDKEEKFSIDSGIMSRFFSKESIRFGVNKKEHMASGSGWSISKKYIGEGGY